MLTKMFTGLIDTVASQCQVCRQWSAHAICENCVNQFAQPQPRCLTCALPVPAGLSQCGACLKTHPPLDQCLAAVDYAYPWSNLIADFKFRSHTGLAHHLAKLLKASPWVEPTLDEADVLLPMPLSKERLAERGYNQALLMAKALCPTKTQPDVLLRLLHTPAQHTLGRSERLNALDHAFALEPLLSSSVRGAHVVLIDDVMTTGASLYAAARVLRSGGVKRITGMVFARTC